MRSITNSQSWIDDDDDDVVVVVVVLGIKL
jgi:hypothetical protein